MENTIIAKGTCTRCGESFDKCFSMTACGDNLRRSRGEIFLIVETSNYPQDGVRRTYTETFVVPETWRLVYDVPESDVTWTVSVLRVPDRRKKLRDNRYTLRGNDNEKTSHTNV